MKTFFGLWSLAIVLLFGIQPRNNDEPLATVPRATPLTRPEMKRMLEDMKQRKERIPLPALSDEEKEKAQSDPRAFGYEGRLRSTYIPNSDAGGYLSFGGTSANSRSGASSQTGVPDRNGRIPQPQDPALSLTYLFKTQLFWIAARGNNCQYCLGHQESKLLAAGMIEDQLAALDTDWESFEEKERVAFALARKLTLEPHRIRDQDIEACRKYYSDLQILEMVSSVAGNNAINRWKEGTGVPQSSNGGNFGGRSANPTEVSAVKEEHTYLTPTSPKFASVKSTVVRVPKSDETATQAPTVLDRSDLDTWDGLQKELDRARHRIARLPMVDPDKTMQVLEWKEGQAPPTHWDRLMANFAIAGKRAVVGLQAAGNGDELNPRRRALLKWVVARQDRALYVLGQAQHELLESGVDIDGIEKIDRLYFGKGNDGAKVDSADRALMLVAKNLAASPIILTDQQVADAVQEAGPRAVAQTIHYTAFLAAFDRITEAAGLPID